MAIKNKVKKFVDARNLTVYEFQKQTGVAQRTAYDLYNDSQHIPTKPVLEKICATFEIQPGEILEWVRE